MAPTVTLPRNKTFSHINNSVIQGFLALRKAVTTHFSETEIRISLRVELLYSKRNAIYTRAHILFSIYRSKRFKSDHFYADELLAKKSNNNFDGDAIFASFRVAPIEPGILEKYDGRWCLISPKKKKIEAAR